jgi:hypothetical protein
MSPTTRAKPPNARPQETMTPATAGSAPAPTIVPGPPGIAAPGGATQLDGPILEPPGSDGGALAAQAAAVTALSSATVGALYTTNNTTNAWVFLNAIGWRRLSPANAGAHQAMLEIARLARDGNIPVQCEEDGSVIHTIYLW